MVLAPLVLLLAQVGPNPSVQQPIVPPELEEQRRRSAQREPGQVAEAAPQVRSRLSECLQQVGEDAVAAEEYAAAWAAQAGPEERAQALHCQGLTLVRQDRFGEASALFETARAAAPETNPAYRARLGGMAGHAALAGGDAKAAVPVFERAVADAELSADASLVAGLQIDRARALVTAGRGEDAVAALEKARGADPANPQAWLLSATLSRRLERLGEAQRQIERAATLAPGDPAVGLEAGVIAAMAGREKDAMASFRSVLEVAPDSPEAARARTYLAQLNGEATGR